MPDKFIFLRLSWLSGAASLLWCDATAGVAVAAIRAAVRQIVREARQFINQAAAAEDESRQFLGHTMASHQTQGIQQLLAAEKRAAEKVAEARKRKVRRIKQARDEAQAEVELYRQEREKLFRAYEAKHMGSREDVAARIDRDTETHLKILEKNVTDHKDAVIDELIEFACDVVPEAHPNYFVLRKFNRI